MATEDVLDLLIGLVARGGRFRFLGTIRQYGAELLAEAGEEQAVRERHDRHYLALAELAEPDLRGPEQSSWLGWLRAEDANFHAVLRWCRERGSHEPDLGLRLAAALGWYWYVGRRADGRRELSAMLAQVSWRLPVGACPDLPGAVARAAARRMHRPPQPGGQSLAVFASTDDTGRAAISCLLLAVEGVAAAASPATSERSTRRALRCASRVTAGDWPSPISGDGDPVAQRRRRAGGVARRRSLRGVRGAWRRVGPFGGTDAPGGGTTARSRRSSEAPSRSAAPPA